MDLVGLRKALQEEIDDLQVPDDSPRLPLAWVPKAEQLADELTKRSDGSKVREVMLRAAVRLVEQQPSSDEVSRDLPVAVHWLWWHKA